jgi:hypothetical protein
VAPTVPSSIPATTVVPPTNKVVTAVVWYDANGDGVLAPTEARVEGVTVRITCANGFTATTKTGPDGSYIFTNVPEGECTVTLVELPAGYEVNGPGTVKVLGSQAKFPILKVAPLALTGTSNQGLGYGIGLTGLGLGLMLIGTRRRRIDQ